MECDWIIKEIIRFVTFDELKIRHTCCEIEPYDGTFTELESEEILELQDEDREKIERLESLLQEFEEKRGDQDIIAFLKGYWATRMDHVLHEQGGVDEERLREIGVVLYQEEPEEVDVVPHEEETGDIEVLLLREETREIDDEDEIPFYAFS